MDGDSKPAGAAGRPDLWPRLFEIMPGGVVEMRADGSIVHANGRALELLGFSYDTITKRYAQDFEPETIRPDGSPCPASEYPVVQALTTGKEHGPTTIGVYRPDGELRWASFSAMPILEDDGAVSGAVVTFLDVTDRVRAEAALQKSEGRLRSILESAAEIIISTDVEGRITYINRTSPGLTPEQVLGADIRGFTTPETRHALVSALDRAVLHRETVRYECDDPFGRPFEAVMAPVIENGEVTSLTILCVDVSESRRLRAQLMVSDRLASVGTLAAGVAHEINNPLTYVLASLRLVERELGELNSGVSRSALERIEQAVEGAERISQVVRDLSTFAGERVAVDACSDLGDVVATTLRIAGNQTRFRATVSVRGTPGLLVRAEPSRLGQVLLNLVVNAAQAIPEGHAGEHEIVVSWEQVDDGRVAIRVTDDGQGIDEAHVARIFEPFFTTKPVGVGTGLGLYICSNIITSLEGTIEVESQLGKGTTVELVLPAARPRTSMSTPPVGTDAVERALRVLVIEDEPMVLRVVADALHDHVVVGCDNAREALACLTEQSFDVILCDLIMPNLTGMDVYEALQRERPQLCDRIVFMSGGTFTERSQAFRRAVSNSFLEKPFTMNELRQAVAKQARRSSRRARIY